VSSCVTVYETASNRSFSGEYNPGEHQLHPDYALFMKSPDDYRLYFRFFPKELAFIKDKNDSVPRAKVRLFFRVTKGYSSIEIVDSLTKEFTFNGKPRPQFLGFVPVRFPDEGSYIIELFLTDLRVNETTTSIIDVTASNKGSEHSFILVTPYGTPFFHRFFTVSDTFRLRADMFESNPISVTFYPPDTIIPDPPDISATKAIEPLNPDSGWVIQKIDTSLLSYPRQGIYFFSDQNHTSGHYFSAFNLHYPYAKTADRLLKPLVYLCTNKEMKKLEAMSSAKEAVDSFWLSLTGELEKSRELIRVYYNRVQLANYYFSSYKEGWLTDRGMIYVICGAPAFIRKDDEGESWIYGKGSEGAIKFYFDKKEFPPFGNEFVLDRSETYSRMWFNAISSWRDGKVFSLNP